MNRNPLPHLVYVVLGSSSAELYLQLYLSCVERRPQQPSAVKKGYLRSSHPAKQVEGVMVGEIQKLRLAQSDGAGLLWDEVDLSQQLSAGQSPLLKPRVIWGLGQDCQLANKMWVSTETKLVFGLCGFHSGTMVGH